MSRRITGKEVANGLIWKFSERILAQLVSTIVSVVLARILLPTEYGVVTVVMIFINIANVFVTSGFGQALIQNDDASDLEFSTMTYVSVGLSIVIYFFLFLLAPFIGDYYGLPLLSSVLRVLALRIPIAGFNSIQQAYVQKNLLFRKFFRSTLIGTILSGVVGVFMAYRGFGVWSLVAQYLTNSVINTIVLGVTIEWRPRAIFSREKAQSLLSYSWKLIVSDFVGAIYNELRGVVIGRTCSITDLAYFNKGEQFPKLVIDNVNSSIVSVLFPAMARVSDTLDNLKDMTRKSIRTSSFFLFPMLIGLSVIAPTFISVLLTDKWLPSVTFMRIACYSLITVPLSSANLQALKAIGRSDIVMKLELIKKLVGSVLIIISVRYGVLAIAASGLVYSVFAVIANAVPSCKLLNYSYIEQINDVFPFAVISFIMGICIQLVKMIPLSDICILIIQIILGAFVYFLLAYLTKNEIMLRLLLVAKKVIR